MLFYIIAAITGIISLVIFFVMNGAKKDVKNKKVILFNLLFSIIIALFGFLGKMLDCNESVWWFVFLQFIFLLLGSLFYYLLQKDFFGEFKNPDLSKLLLLIANTAFGFIGFCLLFEYLQKGGLALYYGMSTFTFLIPFGFMFAFELLASIPPEIHKIWYYPLNVEEPDFDKINLNNIYILELEFSKSPSDDTQKNYKAKAPIDMLFGEWYRSFINNYNYKFEEDPIQFLDSNREPHGWMFFTKPQSFLQTKKFIDPDISIKNNKLTEKTIIVAKRVAVEN